MSMSTSVVGLRNLDIKFNDMIKLKKMCEKSKVSYPKELIEYFGKNNVGESEEYLKSEMTEIEIEDEDFVSAWKAEMQEGFEIEVDKIPKEIKTIRFYNSY